MGGTFPKAYKYLTAINIETSDKIDQVAKGLLDDEAAYEKASQALRRRFSRGAPEVKAVDRGGRLTRIKREKRGGKYTYQVEGVNGSWTQPEERIWIVAMYALWQKSKQKPL